MSFFSRLSDIIASNLNTLIDKAENPQETLAKVVQEIESGVESARRSATSAMTNARRMKAELDLYRDRMAFWDAKAREAVDLGRDDLARRCLMRKRELADLSSALEQQYDSAMKSVEQLKTTLRAVEARLSEALRRQGEMRTPRTPPVEDVPPPAAVITPITSDLKGRLAKLEAEIAQGEAEIVVASATAEAEALLEAAQRELDECRDLEAELAAIKGQSKQSGK